jgi:hypothetical protein
VIITPYRDGNQANELDLLPFVTESHPRSQEAKKMMQMISQPLTPSLTAQLPQQEKISKTIKSIDLSFENAIEEYKVSYQLARAEDLKVYNQIRNSSLDFSLAVATASSRLIMKTPNIPVVKQIVGPLLGLVGGFYGAFKNRKFTEERKKEEQSANRSKWLTEIKIKEESRIKEAIVAINERAMTIKSIIETTKKEYSQDDPLVLELIQLDKLMNHLSPRTPLMLNETSVSDFLYPFLT